MGRPVGRIDARWQQSVSRRKAIAKLAGALAGSPLLQSDLAAQRDPRPFNDHKRLPGLNEMMVSFDFEPVCFANVSQVTYDYTAHGDGSEFTVRRNRQAFDWVDLVPGKPIDPKTIDLSTEILGTKMSYPIMVAPSAAQVPLHPDGEIGMHRGATAAANTPTILSHVSSLPVDKVAGAATGSLWAQFYPQQDRTVGRKILDEAQAAGWYGDRGDGRSAGVCTTSAASTIGISAAAPAAPPPVAPPRQWVWVGRVATACPPPGSGTRGVTSTRFARSSRCR